MKDMTSQGRGKGPTLGVERFGFEMNFDLWMLVSVSVSAYRSYCLWRTLPTYKNIIFLLNISYSYEN